MILEVVRSDNYETFTVTSRSKARPELDLSKTTITVWIPVLCFVQLQYLKRGGSTSKDSCRYTKDFVFQN